MSSGSYFTLYRKYKTTISAEERAEIVKRYVQDGRDNGLASKTDEELAADLPAVLDPKIGIKESVYDEQTKTWNDIRDYSIAGRRANYLKVFRDDDCYLDELLTWSFCSSFNCLKTEWGMEPYNWKRSQHVIDKTTAMYMLQACNYLLSGKWSDELERILDNKWIKIFADGNDCCSYWKYIYRNNKKALHEIEKDEDSDEVEWQLSRMAIALETFVKAETEYLDNDKIELVLVYTAW